MDCFTIAMKLGTGVMKNHTIMDSNMKVNINRLLITKTNTNQLDVMLILQLKLVLKVFYDICMYKHICREHFFMQEKFDELNIRTHSKHTMIVTT